MKKILGLDLGTTSIGWSLVKQSEDEKFHIKGMGVRIIPLTVDESSGFSKGNGYSKNAERTTKRGIRRSQFRYKLRKQFLIEAFNKLNMMPDKKLFQLSALELYGLHDKAVKEQISLQELARIFFHLNQKRGYKSNRKTKEDGDKTTGDSKSKENVDDKIEIKKKKKGLLDEIKEREEFVKDQTVGQYFYKELLDNPFYRIKEEVFMRKSYENEFDLIWEVQKQFYPEVLNELNRKLIRDEIIYYHRPLKSQKGLVSLCAFESRKYISKKNGIEKEVLGGPKVIPKSSPLFQVSKIWQELNNIVIRRLYSNKKKSDSQFGFDNDNKRSLTLDEKKILFKLLNTGAKLASKQILKEIGFKSDHDDYEINIRKNKNLETNRTLTQIIEVFKKLGFENEELIKFDLEIEPSQKIDKTTGEVSERLVVKDTFEKQPLYQLWHILYSVDDTDKLLKTLQLKFNLPENVAIALSNLDFTTSGYGEMSAAAIRKILPYLFSGDMYSIACSKAGYNHSNSETTEEKNVRALIDKLELYPKNSLRQPIVEKIINQVINLVNEIIDEKNGFVTKEERLASDRFEIRIELARDLKQSAEERDETDKRNRAEKARHDKITKILIEHGISRVSKNDIERYKLWEEFEGVSPYEPHKKICLSELFNQVSGVLYDIEHIIPKSKIFDDAFSNKTIAPRRLNSDKGNNTAYDFMKSRSEAELHDYIEFLKKHHYKKDGISKTKLNKLMMPESKIPDDFISRQMNETRFISKEVRNLLKNVCRNVYSSTGTITSRLRHLWGWDDVLMNLQIDKYRTIEQTEWITYVNNGQEHKIERIKDWTKRDDHRHHAIDALSIACTQQGFIQRISSLNAEHTRNEIKEDIKNSRYNEKLSLLEKYLINQKPFDTATVQTHAAQILISFKSGKKLFSKSKNKIKNGKKIIEVRESIIPRGKLHEETVYGKIKRYKKIKLSTRFTIADLKSISELKTREKVEAHLMNFNNDPKKAFSSKELEKFKQVYGFDEVTIFETEAVVKYPLNKEFKAEYLKDIVDEGIKKIVSNHLEKFENNPKLAFTADKKVWYNEERGIAITRVRCKTGLTSLKSLHTNALGEPIDFVKSGNNHHIAIYRDEKGNFHENSVSFSEAFERKLNDLPVIVKNPKQTWDAILITGFDNQKILGNIPNENLEFVASLQQNEMFIIGLTETELSEAIDVKNYSLISKFLYRVQNIATKQYIFRHHLETKDLRDSNARATKQLIQLSPSSFKAIKVKLNSLGNIIKVGE